MIIRALVALVDASRRHAGVVLALAFLVAAGSLFISAERLGVDTDTGNLISPKLLWRQQAHALEQAFPQNAAQTVIVIDGASTDAVERGTALLAEALRRRPDLFKTVQQPDSGAFFNRYGFLFLSTKELGQLSNDLAAAEPLLGPLSADPSLRGLFGVLGQALTGIETGQAPAQSTEDRLAQPVAAIAKTVSSVVAGKPVALDWGRLMSAKPPRPEQLRHFILVQPKLDFSRVEPGRPASDAIRAAAQQQGLGKMGLRVRLTGEIPLEDDEFASVSEGAVWSTSLSMLAVIVILLVGLRAPRLIGAIVLTLIVGLLATAGFAALAVGTLNLISIAFAVLFIGIGVDFGIQFTMRYRAELFEVASAEPDRAGLPAPAGWAATNQTALGRTARGIAGPLGVAALATCVGFFSFLPTDYQGVSELGLIAGTSMLIALAANLTVLPALLTFWPARGKPEEAGFVWARPLDRWLVRRAGLVTILASCLGLAALASVPWVRFDADPLDLRDPKKESVATALELSRDPLTTSYTIEILRPNQAAAEALASRLDSVPLVKQSLTLASFVPQDQAAKLDIIDQTRFLMGPILDGMGQAPPPDSATERRAVADFATHLRRFVTGPKAGSLAGPGLSLATALDAFLQMPGGGDIGLLQQSLLSGLSLRLSAIRTAFEASPITVDTMPPEIRQNWIAADGRARVSVAPAGDMHDPAQMAAFVAAVRKIAPDATGAPVTILESGRTVSHAFATASCLAIIAITLVLALVLRRASDVFLVLAPLLLAGLYALGTSVALDDPFNYANVIAIPLLMGIGVAFDIYFVMNWRREALLAGGASPPPHLLQTATARAIVFSACTTGSAFGSLVVSHHLGMASMGRLLLTTLGYVLICSLFVQPALMSLVARRAARGAG